MATLAGQDQGWRAGESPWPQPARESVRDRVLFHATAHPAWGHRKIWAMVRHDGYVVSEATVLRLLRDEGLILPAYYQRERRRLAERRTAAFAKESTGPGLAARLQRVRDPGGRDVADRGVPGLLVHVRVSVPCVADGEPA